MVEDENGDIWAATAVAGIWRIVRTGNKYDVRCYNVSSHNASIIGAVTLGVDNQNRIRGKVHDCMAFGSVGTGYIGRNRQR